MNKFNLTEQPHRRFNRLTGEWVLVSPHRTKRPWKGKVEDAVLNTMPDYDEKCYLCPGNERAGGKINPDYTNTFVFTNDFSALLPDGPKFISESDELLKLNSVSGTSRVICYSPRHNLSLAEMKVEDINQVIQVWNDQLNELGEKYKWVQIFENKGAIMGCSNPHPHGQIWAQDFLPNEIVREDVNQKKYLEKNNSVLLIDYLKTELIKKDRILIENDDWVSLVPFWAVWPFETMILPKRHIKRLNELTENEKSSLAEILKVHLTKYDNLFNTIFPYTMGWHGAPNDNAEYNHWQLHLHFYPPLLRSATIKKFMVGYEMLSEAQRDITAEQAAERLKDLPEIHFKKTNDN